MGFTVRLANDESTVEPGSSAPVAFELINDGDKEEEFEVSVEGLDPEWTAIPVPTLWVAAGETRVDRIFIKPPRESESRAGVYPFVIKVRSMDSGESRTAQSSLAVNPFSHVSIEASPKRAELTALNRSSQFEVTVMNLGNTEENLQLYASDVDDLIAFDFAQNQVTLAPGQSKVIAMTATGTKVKALQGLQVAPVTVSARSTDRPAVAANCQLHVEIRPVVSPGPMIAAFVVLALLVGWILSIPKPPTIANFSVQPREALVGDQIEISWEAKNASSVTIAFGETTYEMQPVKGSLPITAEKAGAVPIHIYAVSGDIKSDPVNISVEVKDPPTVPEPEILAFAAGRSEVPLGSSIVIDYRLNDAATYAYLEPIGNIDPKARSIQVPSPPDDLPGKGVKTITYTLIVRNAQGREVSKKITVKFVKDSKAVISQFVAEPAEIDPAAPQIILRWKVAGATRLELLRGDQREPLTELEGQREFSLGEETTFTLVATDPQGLENRKTVTVKIKKPTEPTVEPGTTGTSGDTAGDPGGVKRPVGGGNRV